MSKILITGYKGFIGKHLYDAWKDSYKVDCFGRGDQLPNRDYDLVFHLAGSSGVRSSWKNPWRYFKDNVLLSRKIFKKYKRVIYTSSSAVKEPWRSPYALTRYLVEKIAPKNSLGIRLTTVYGPDGRKNMLISKILDNKLPYVNVDCVRDFIHIYDVLKFFNTVMNYRLERIIEVGTGISTPIVDLVDSKTMKKYSPFYEIKTDKVNIEKARSLGFKHTYDIKKFIRENKC